MFDFSLAEILLIIIVAVIFIGPDELPVVIKTLSKAVRAVRSLYKEMRAMFDEISREVGLDDEFKDNEVRLIKGDDGKMYETYTHPLPPSVTIKTGQDHGNG